MPHPPWYTTRMKMKMKLTKEEAKFLASALTKWAEVTAIEINDVEIRVHGIYELSPELRKQLPPDYEAGSGSTALYRKPFDVEKAYNHHTSKINKSWERQRQTDMNDDVYIREDEDYLDRD